MSSQKTPNLNMHKWLPTDYVKLDEFNENFTKLDVKAKEITDAATDIDGVVQAGLPERLTADFGKVTVQLAESKNKINYNNTQFNSLIDYSKSLNEYTIKPVSNESGHKAFPSIIKFLDQYIIFYRVGTDHGQSYDGKIVYKTSSDGVTWSAETTLLQTADKDYRDPCAIIFNNQLVLKYFYSNTGGTIKKTCVVSTTDLVSWTNEVELPSPNNVNNASRGNMAIKDGILYAINYTTSTNYTYIASTSDLINWTIVTSLLKDNSNEGSIVYTKGKFICALRQYIIIEGSDYYNPILYGESLDAVNWTFKELPVRGHCPSLHILSVNASTDRLILTYRDPSQLPKSNRNHFNFIMLTRNGEMYSSRIYNLLWATSRFDLGYGDVLIDGSKTYIAYYFADDGVPSDIKSHIYLSKFNTSDLNIFSGYPNRPRISYLSSLGNYSEKVVRRGIAGDINVNGNGTSLNTFTIDLTPFKIDGAVINVHLVAYHSSGVFRTRLTSFSNTQITGILKTDDGSTFSAAGTIKVYWDATIIDS